MVRIRCLHCYIPVGLDISVQKFWRLSAGWFGKKSNVAGNLVLGKKFLENKQFTTIKDVCLSTGIWKNTNSKTQKVRCKRMKIWYVTEFLWTSTRTWNLTNCSITSKSQLKTISKNLMVRFLHSWKYFLLQSFF